MTIQTHAPETSGALPDLVSGIEAPLFIGHRGAGLLFPEHSMEGYRAVAADGFPAEPDVRTLADGTLVCIHDETVTRTMSSVTGEVASQMRDEWVSAQIKPGPGGITGARPVLFDEVLDELGGKALVVPELKVFDPYSVEAFIAAIVERGLKRAVLVQALDYGVAKQLAEAGMATLLLILDEHNLPDSLENIRAAGIEYIGPSFKASDSFIAEAAQAGLRSIVWTVNTRQQAQEQFARGVFGLFSDDVWTTSGRVAAGLTEY